MQAKPALEAIQEYGITLLLLGVVVTLMPMIVQFPINYFALRIKNPVEACAVVTGSRSGNPGFATLLGKSRELNTHTCLHHDLCRGQYLPHTLGTFGCGFRSVGPNRK